MVISGCVGPSDDGYHPAERLSETAAEAYHSIQIGTFADTAADMVCAITMTYAEEAIGVTRAAVRVGLPVAISFTVETDGRLPSGQPLGEAIAHVDAATGRRARVLHDQLRAPDALRGRARRPLGRARARPARRTPARLSHAELDAATELDPGDPQDLGERYAALRAKLRAPERGRRLLRHRPPPRRRDRGRLANLRGLTPLSTRPAGPEAGRRSSSSSWPR